MNEFLSSLIESLTVKSLLSHREMNSEISIRQKKTQTVDGYRP